MKLFRLPAKYEDFREGKKKEMTRRRKKKEERRKKKEERRKKEEKKNHNKINETSTDRNTQEKRLSAGQEKVG